MASKRDQKEQDAALEAFLGTVYAGTKPTEDDLEGLVSLGVREDQRIEYKGEGWADKTKDGSRKTGRGNPRSLQDRVAKYLAGFANGVGGVLVIGVDEAQEHGRDNGVPVRARAIPESRRDEVVAQVDQGVRSLFGQLPRGCIPHYVPAREGGFYVVAGVRRAARLVSVAQSNHILFYMRIHDSTTHAPDYLAADLFLGRRQQPISRAVEATASRRNLVSSSSDMKPRVTFENVGLAWMEHPRAGFIGIHMGKDRGALSSNLDSEVRVFETDYSCRKRGPYHYRARAMMHSSLGDRVPPMDGFYVETVENLPSPHLDHQVVLWAFALYLVCLNQKPEWYQVLVITAPHHDPVARVIPCPDRKPVVAYHTRETGGRWYPPITWARWEDGHQWSGFHPDRIEILDEDDPEDGEE